MLNLKSLSTFHQNLLSVAVLHHDAVFDVAPLLVETPQGIVGGLVVKTADEELARDFRFLGIFAGGIAASVAAAASAAASAAAASTIPFRHGN